MELRHLRYFTAVAAERSFSRAAEKLHVAQPPLSRQVQQLEDELGARLLDRGRPVTLTAVGGYVYDQAQQVLQKIEEIKTTSRRMAKGSSVRLGIGFVASTLYDALPEVIRRFRITSPNVAVPLVEMTTVEQIAALKEGRIDVGFGRLPFDEDGITRRTIRDDRLILALPLRHRLLNRPAVKLRDVAGEPLILDYRMPRPSYADLVLSYFRDRGLAPKLAFEVRDLQTALGLVASGAGISIVPASVRRLSRDDVAYLEFDERRLIVPIIMSFRTDDRSPFLAHLRKLIREFDEWTEPSEPPGVG
jgi:LysR family transcriptional regulator, benzoate and cis,cis-muconate-responsive activator of ben and cat genes